MAFSIKIVDTEEVVPLNLVVSATQSSDIVVDSIEGVPDGTLQEVIEYLADQHFTSTETPSGDNVGEGDTWYKTDSDQYYVYRETSVGVFEWVPVILGNAGSTSDTLDAGTF